MQITDIKVGRKYSHKAFPGTVYLGCLSADRTRKFLVIIDDGEPDSNGSTLGHEFDFAGIMQFSYGQSWIGDFYLTDFV